MLGSDTKFLITVPQKLFFDDLFFVGMSLNTIILNQMS